MQKLPENFPIDIELKSVSSIVSGRDDSYHVYFKDKSDMIIYAPCGNFPYWIVNIFRHVKYMGWLYQYSLAFNLDGVAFAVERDENGNLIDTITHGWSSTGVGIEAYESAINERITYQ